MRGASLMFTDSSRRTLVDRITLRMVRALVLLGEVGHRDRECVVT